MKPQRALPVTQDSIQTEPKRRPGPGPRVSAGLAVLPTGLRAVLRHKFAICTGDPLGGQSPRLFFHSTRKLRVEPSTRLDDPPPGRRVAVPGRLRFDRCMCGNPCEYPRRHRTRRFGSELRGQSRPDFVHCHCASAGDCPDNGIDVAGPRHHHGVPTPALRLIGGKFQDFRKVLVVSEFLLPSAARSDAAVRGCLHAARDDAQDSPGSARVRCISMIARKSKVPARKPSRWHPRDAQGLPPRPTT